MGNLGQQSLQGPQPKKLAKKKQEHHLTQCVPAHLQEQKSIKLKVGFLYPYLKHVCDQLRMTLSLLRQAAHYSRADLDEF